MSAEPQKISLQPLLRHFTSSIFGFNLAIFVFLISHRRFIQTSLRAESLIYISKVFRTICTEAGFYIFLCNIMEVLMSDGLSLFRAEIFKMVRERVGQLPHPDPMIHSVLIREGDLHVKLIVVSLTFE